MWPEGLSNPKDFTITNISPGEMYSNYGTSYGSHTLTLNLDNVSIATPSNRLDSLENSVEELYRALNKCIDLLNERGYDITFDEIIK